MDTITQENILWCELQTSPVLNERSPAKAGNYTRLKEIKKEEPVLPFSGSLFGNQTVVLPARRCANARVTAGQVIGSVGVNEQWCFNPFFAARARRQVTC